MNQRAGSKALIKEINQALVLDVVRGGTVSRATNAQRTGLSAATVTGIVSRFIADGLVVETDVVRTTGGRPARLVDLASGGLVTAGVRLSATEVYAVLVNLRGEQLAGARRRLRSTTPAACAKATAALVDSLVAGQPRARLAGVGVAVSGVVDQDGGRILHSGAMGWEDVDLQTELAAVLDAPVVIDSYANALALGLVLFDGELDGRDLLVFSVGTSLGASVVTRGSVHRGFNGTAGGFAHSVVSLRGGIDRPCHCGAVNCLETWSSLWGIEQELVRLGRSFGEWDGADDPVVSEAGTQLGVALANVAKVFGPQDVVVAVAPELDLPSFVDVMTERYHREYTHEHNEAPNLVHTRADQEALARGAAYVLLRQMFTLDGRPTSA
jgi:predicted NBD/HSP70 family sugar kinase